MINNVQTSDSTNYTVRAFNSSSSVTSSVAFLTVTGAPSCMPISWTAPKLNYTKNGTNLVLSWTNPVTNTCNNTLVFTLQQTLVLSNAPGTTPWTNVTNTSPFTTSFTNHSRYFRLKL